MKVAVVGTGYVGLVTGACLAGIGHEVVCIDKDASKIRKLEAGVMPIYEPGLADLVLENALAGRLRFTSRLAEGIAEAQFVFVAVGTPQGEDGAADLSAVWAVGREIARHLKGHKVIVTKSTVPVGTNAKLARLMSEATETTFDVASNPEFLKQGAAIRDFNEPDRIVVGVRRPEVADWLRELYRPLLGGGCPLLVMSPESAELTKYAANCLLATRLTLFNEIANLCSHVDANIDDVRQGIGHDGRIGFGYLTPGPGYGGSCLPKDVRALIHLARDEGGSIEVLEAVDAVNEHQKTRLGRMIIDHFGGSLVGRRVAIWGLSFKPDTDDIRDSPALVLIDQLLAAGAFVRVADPQSLPHVRDRYGRRLTYCEHRYTAIEQADALAIATEWPEYLSPDFILLADLMRGRALFDGRNVLDPERAARHGFRYHGIGRPRRGPAAAATRPRVQVQQHGPAAAPFHPLTVSGPGVALPVLRP